MLDLKLYEQTERELEAINRDFVFVKGQNEIYELATEKRLSVAHFKSIHQDNRLLVQKVNSNGHKYDTDAAAGDEWMKYQLRRKVTDYVFRPYIQVEGPPYNPFTDDGYLNLYRGLPGEEVWLDPVLGDDLEPVAPAPWEELMQHFFHEGETDDEDFEARAWFECWVAMMLRFPGIKHHNAVLFHGIEGTGKSLIGEIVASLFGRYAVEVNQKQLVSDFNEWANMRLFVLANEVFNADKRSQVSAWKNLITQESVTINAKFKSELTFRDTMNFLFTSNCHDAMALDKTDRRIFVWRCDRKLATNTGARIKSWALSRRGRNELRAYLLALDCKQFFRVNDDWTKAVSTVPMNRHKAAMQDAALSDLDTAARQAVEAIMAEDGGDGELVRRSTESPRDLFTLEQAVRLAGLDPDKVNKKAFSNSLLRAGAARRPEKQIRVKGERQCVWIAGNIEHWQGKSSVEIGQAMRSELRAKY